MVGKQKTPRDRLLGAIAPGRRTLPSLTPSLGIPCTICVLGAAGSSHNVFHLPGPLGDSLHDPPLHVLTEFLRTLKRG